MSAHERRYGEGGGDSPPPWGEPVVKQHNPPGANFPVVRERWRKVLEEGEVKHPGSPWMDMPSAEHWTHFCDHLAAYRCGALDGEDHLGHAMVRLLMYVELVSRGEHDGKQS